MDSAKKTEEISAGIEAILFWKGEPMGLKRLATALNCSEEEIRNGLEILKSRIVDRGVTIIEKDGEVLMGITPKLAPLIEQLTKEELTRDLGKAGLETIAIIAYKGPITRAEIDYIRGVQSTFILRNLQIRGLVEKVVNPKDARSFLYRPTFDLLRFLGLNRIEDLPEFEAVKVELSHREEEVTSTEPQLLSEDEK